MQTSVLETDPGAVNDTEKATAIVDVEGHGNLSNLTQILVHPAANKRKQPKTDGNPSSLPSC